MCLGAILWSNIAEVYYGCDVKDTENIGFRDDKFYQYMQGGDQKILARRQLGRKQCLSVFDEYFKDQARTAY
jgi:tRNA(Arg) A34 adenosine deaminase TadA